MNCFAEGRFPRGDLVALRSIPLILSGGLLSLMRECWCADVIGTYYSTIVPGLGAGKMSNVEQKVKAKAVMVRHKYATM